ncbi:MAG: RNA methyltransferase [Burkholderiaceae bacterium]|nr:RNA methyltransferase [Burkholderiaceae bacterium]
MPASRAIVSASNERFRRLLELTTSARERRRQGLSVIEGVHLVQAWLACFGAQAGDAQVFVPRRGLDSVEVRALIGRLPTPPTVLDDRLFARASQVEHGSGPLAIVPTPCPALPARLQDDAVYLDRVQDPGNVGGILRTCAAVGVRRVIASPGTAFCWSPKVLRAGMGAHFHLEIHEGIAPAVLRERAALQVRAAQAHAPLSLYRADLRAPALWLFGNEGQGLDAGLRTWPAVVSLGIPQSPAVESLNVGVAAAVCLFEQLRQRTAAHAAA